MLLYDTAALFNNYHLFACAQPYSFSVFWCGLLASFESNACLQGGGRGQTVLLGSNSHFQNELLKRTVAVLRSGGCGWVGWEQTLQ